MLAWMSVFYTLLVINIVGNKKDLVNDKDVMSEHELEHLTNVG